MSEEDFLEERRKRNSLAHQALENLAFYAGRSTISSFINPLSYGMFKTMSVDEVRMAIIRVCDKICETNTGDDHTEEHARMIEIWKNEP